MIDFCVILTLVCSLRACHMWLTRNRMFFRKILGKFTTFIFWNFEISKFQKSELGQFIPNFPLKHWLLVQILRNFIRPNLWNYSYNLFKLACGWSRVNQATMPGYWLGGPVPPIPTVILIPFLNQNLVLICEGW